MLKSRVDAIGNELGRVQGKEKTHALDEFQNTADQLNAVQKRLDRLIHFRNASNEIQKDDADLGAVTKWLPTFRNHQAYKGEAGRIQDKIKRLEKNDHELKALLDSVDTLLDQKADISNLLSAFGDMEKFDKKATTLRQEHAQQKNRLRLILHDSIPEFLADFEKLPSPDQIKESKAQLEWLKKEFPDYEGLDNIEGAICQAEADKAEKKSMWHYAWIKWREAANHGRDDAREREMACLKLWAITEAAQENYNVLANRALMSHVLRDDELLNRFEIKRLLKEKVEEYQKPEKLLEKEQSSVDLNKIQNRIVGVKEGVGEDIDKDGTSQYLAVWYQYNYLAHIEREILDALPTLDNLRKELELYKRIFPWLILLAKKVRPENRLMELHQGVQSANRWLRDLKDNFVFKEAWDRLVDHVVLKLEHETGGEGKA